MEGGPTARCPTPPPSAGPAGEKPLGGGGAFKTKKCCVKPRGRGREEGGGGTAQGRLAFPSNPAERTSPPPSAKAAAPPGKGRRRRRRAELSHCFPLHFSPTQVGKGRGWPPRSGSSPSPEPRVRSGPVTARGSRADRVPGHAERSEAAPQPLGRASRAGRAAPPRLRTPSSPSGQEAGSPGRSPEQPTALCGDLVQPQGSGRSSESAHARASGSRKLSVARRLLAHGRPVADSGRGLSRVCGWARETWSPGARDTRRAPCSTGGARPAGPPAAGQQGERAALGAGARAPAEAAKRVPV